MPDSVADVSVKTVWALVGALGCALIAVVTWAVAFRTGMGHAADARVLGKLSTLQDTRAAPLAQLVGVLGNPVPYAVLSAALMGTALVARGARVAAVVAAVLVVPNVVTQWLKLKLAEPRGATISGEAVDAVSWPSGHSTAAMALAVAALLVASGAWRPTVAVAGGLFAVAMAGSVVLLGWHFPSDAVGGFAVAGVAGCLGAAALSRRAATTAPESRWHRATG